MGELIDFQTRRARKDLKKSAGNKGVIYEIYLTVVKYVNENLQKEYEKPVENINTKTPLSYVFQGESDRFRSSFGELMNYWDLPSGGLDEVPYGEEFQYFKTVEDLCWFIEKRVRKSNN
jgi:hypothetical protein